ncbi:hypothetical protein AB0J83_38410, partial [Actinoplanes sp. NPDC049596]
MTTGTPSDDSHRVGAIIWAAAAAGGGDLDPALADFPRLPAGTPGRPGLAAALVHAIVRREPHLVASRMRVLDDLVAVADLDPPPAAQWRPL